MQINRFYLDKIIFDQDGILKLPDSISRQLIHVLRCKVNDQAVIFDGSGFDYKVKIVNITNKICSVKFLEKISLDTDNKVKITIFISLIKQNRFEVALQKCTELGVFAFVPFYSSRSIFQLDKKSSSVGDNKFLGGNQSFRKHLNNADVQIFPVFLILFLMKLRVKNLKIVFL